MYLLELRPDERSNRIFNLFHITISVRLGWIYTRRESVDTDSARDVGWRASGRRRSDRTQSTSVRYQEVISAPFSPHTKSLLSIITSRFAFIIYDDIDKYIYLLFSVQLADDEDNERTSNETTLTMRRMALAAIMKSGGAGLNGSSSSLASSCYDLRFACKKWVQMNENLCETVPIFMHLNCQYSCSRC